MQVKVLYFGILKDHCGCNHEEVELPVGSLADSLVRRVEERGAAGAVLTKSLAIAVNREYVPSSTVLHEGDEVALLPPVSGGSHAR